MTTDLVLAMEILKKFFWLNQSILNRYLENNRPCRICSIFLRLAEIYWHLIIDEVSYALFLPVSNKNLIIQN